MVLGRGSETRQGWAHRAAHESAARKRAGTIGNLLAYDEAHDYPISHAPLQSAFTRPPPWQGAPFCPLACGSCCGTRFTLSIDAWLASCIDMVFIVARATYIWFLARRLCTMDLAVIICDRHREVSVRRRRTGGRRADVRPLPCPIQPFLSKL